MPAAELGDRCAGERQAYLTPSDSQGFAHHYDTHSVLIVQTAGSKTWQLHTPVYANPLEHQPFNGQSVSEAEWDRMRNGKPFLEATLQAGDTLWIPRGWIHNGFATDNHSLHVSFSFPALTPYWVAMELAKALGDEPAFRAELDWGFGRSRDVQVTAIAATAKLLAEQFATLDADAQAEDLADRYRRYFLEAVRQPVATNFLDEPGEQTPVRTVGIRLRDHLRRRRLRPAPPRRQCRHLRRPDGSHRRPVGRGR